MFWSKLGVLFSLTFKIYGKIYINTYQNRWQYLGNNSDVHPYGTLVYWSSQRRRGCTIV